MELKPGDVAMEVERQCRRTVSRDEKIRDLVEFGLSSEDAEFLLKEHEIEELRNNRKRMLINFIVFGLVGLGTIAAVGWLVIFGEINTERLTKSMFVWMFWIGAFLWFRVKRDRSGP